MKGKKVLSLIVHLTVFVCSLLIFTGNSYAASPATISLSKTYNWKMTAFFPAGHNENKQLVQFIDTLNKRTNGAVKVSLYESTLGSPNDHWDMLKNNAVQLAFLAEGYSVGRMPVGSLLNLPFEFNNMADMYKTYAEWLKAGHLKEMTDNFKVVFYKPTMFQHFFFRNKKVTKLEDFKGLKLRVPEVPIYIAFYKGLGSLPTPMAITEVPTALQQKTVDGQDNGAIITYDFGFHQFQKYMTRANQIYSGSQLLISKKKFDSLTDAQKQIVMTAAKNAGIAQVKMNREMVEGYYKEMAASGVEVIDATPALSKDMAVVAEKVWTDPETVKSFGKETIDRIVAEKNK